MNFLFKLATVFALTAILAVPFSMHGSPQMGAAHSSGGCHEDIPMPVPQPANYSCCQGGHNSAILQTAHYEEMVSATLHLQDMPPIATSYASAIQLEEEALSTYQPPGLPLRI